MSSDYSDKPLPPNWESRLDSESGLWFYINHEEKTTSWDDPRPAYYSAQQLDRLNTYRMGFGDRQDLIGEFFDIPEISPKSHKNPKSVNPKPCDDRNKDVPTTKTHRSRIEPSGEYSSRKDTNSKGRTTSTHRNRESKSSVCSQNDNESHHSSIYISSKTNKKLKYDSLSPKTSTDNDDHDVNDDDVFAKESSRKENPSKSIQIDKETLQTKLSLEKRLDTPTSAAVILTDNDPFQKVNTAEISVEKQSLNNGSSIYSNRSMGLILPSTEKSHRYQPIGPNPKLLSSRIIPHGPNPLFVHGPNPSLVHGSIYQ
ncbi:unnamed protein product [Schistosoma rodhaini]|uniref:WW domain-containing protein n=1 Tax=Schistosoma rodhaini TaxID=6188 RepID=A0AA85FEU4_9TREM|nr:unnamed protein product [Schistosoma rodhaini]CAH8530224.1 unnamed protein product [Schistosoma rodhaini]